MMRVSTKRGDTGYTSLLGGERVPKYHMRTEAAGTLDEANSFLGLARAAAKERVVKRILLQIQKHLFIIGAEISSSKDGGSKGLKRTITEKEVSWMDGLVEKYEEALALPPGFVVFGQEEASSHMDVARATVRKAERIIVKMKSENLIQNIYILKYLNRLSDLIFLLACFEENEEVKRRKMSRAFFPFHLSEPISRKWVIFSGSIVLGLLAVIFLLLIFHKPSPEAINPPTMEHMPRGSLNSRLTYQRAAVSSLNPGRHGAPLFNFNNMPSYPSAG